jgi:hypothetical protein
MDRLNSFDERRRTTIRSTSFDSINATAIAMIAHHI